MDARKIFYRLVNGDVKAVKASRLHATRPTRSDHELAVEAPVILSLSPDAHEKVPFDEAL